MTFGRAILVVAKRVGDETGMHRDARCYRPAIDSGLIDD